MRNLYLVRHGRVDFPNGVRCCIGWTDLALDEKGRRQARELGIYFQNMKEQKAAVFTSPLVRAQETARILSGGILPVYVEEGLKELNMGEWENIPMNQLKKTLESQPEHGESREEGLIRIRQTINSILAKASGTVICVAHAGINSCLLSDLLGSPLETSRALPQPYGGFTRIQVHNREHMEIKELGIMPKQAPNDEECQDIWEHYHTPVPVRRHCEAVCREAEAIAEKLIKAGQKLDRQVVKSGALLHDVMRTEPNHAEKGAYVLLREGYPAVAEVIRCHHDLESPEYQEAAEKTSALWLEKAVVYLADKQVQGDTVVSLEQRFADSRKRCEHAQDRQAALAAHERRYRQTKEVENLIQMKINGGQKQ